MIEEPPRRGASLAGMARRAAILGSSKPTHTATEVRIPWTFQTFLQLVVNSFLLTACQVAQSKQTNSTLQGCGPSLNAFHCIRSGNWGPTKKSDPPTTSKLDIDTTSLRHLHICIYIYIWCRVAASIAPPPPMVWSPNPNPKP